jgi:hypothetical protein
LRRLEGHARSAWPFFNAAGVDDCQADADQAQVEIDKLRQHGDGNIASSRCEVYSMGILVKQCNATCDDIATMMRLPNVGLTAGSRRC